MAGDAPNIRSVRAMDGRRLVIAWRGGAESVVDIAEHIDKFAIFAPLRDDDSLFRDVTVGEWGEAYIGRTRSRFPPIRSGVWLSNREVGGCAHGVRRMG